MVENRLVELLSCGGHVGKDGYAQAYGCVSLDDIDVDEIRTRSGLRRAEPSRRQKLNQIVFVQESLLGMNDLTAADLGFEANLSKTRTHEMAVRVVAWSFEIDPRQRRRSATLREERRNRKEEREARTHGLASTVRASGVIDQFSALRPQRRPTPAALLIGRPRLAYDGPMHRRWPLAFLGVAALASAATGCARQVPEPVAFENRVFYHYYDVDADPSAFEKRYPPLDLGEERPNPEYLGVSVIGQSIHLSRPKHWVIRTASNKPEERFIEYVSPNQYLFSIYERVDSPEDLWREVMGRYEAEAKVHGAELLGSRVPVATANAQGRGYLLRRFIPGAKAPYRNMSHEFLLRSDHRIVLVQIVYPTETIQPIRDELLRTIKTFELF